jgi:3-phenylpropionate/trans-cinnamate dioxygenase ferredoxin reductase subunit
LAFGLAALVGALAVVLGGSWEGDDATARAVGGDDVATLVEQFAASSSRPVVGRLERIAAARPEDARALALLGLGYQQLARETADASWLTRSGAALRRALVAGARLTVVGAGWIGCEVAATARGRGADVTVIERASVPLEGVLGPRLGGFFADLHRSHGVDLRLDSGVDRIDSGSVRLTDGSAIDSDAVLLGVGVAPATDLAASGGLVLGDGIVVDEHLRTSAPDVFAAGDVASALHPRYQRHVRVEHWDNAQAQGVAAARSMLGVGEPYAKLPYFFSDQYDLGLEYVGLHGAGDELVIRGSVEEARFQAFWIAADGTVTAGMHVNDWDAIDPIRALVESRAAVNAAHLGDPDRPVPA